jgi:hypothetical protein
MAPNTTFPRARRRAGRRPAPTIERFDDAQAAAWSDLLVEEPT